MANKLFTVVKDGEKLRDVKNLAAAKKLADAEGAVVVCDDKCVYEGTEVLTKSSVMTEETDRSPGGKVLGTETVPEVSRPNKIEKYILTALMNIRKGPSKTAEKAGVAKKGTVVEVEAVKNDWLCLTDGTFILFDGGRFAKKS